MTERRVLNGRYELDELPIGKGGMGEVWLGRDVKLDREVAVKLIRFPGDGSDQEFVRRFVRESRITARLEHPGVPAVYDVGTHDGRPFMVMQRIRGISVADLVAEQGPLPIGWAAAIAAQTCSVLAAAHDAALVHRDLKPGNLMLCPDGTVRVLDFGLAVALASADSQITRTGQTLGTPAYMAPELVLAGTTGPRTDLYALGCTLFEMITGRSPFRGATAYAVMSKHVDELPASIRALRSDVPQTLASLVEELLAKNPDQRPAAAAEVYERLLPFATGLEILPGVLTPPPVHSPVRMYAAVVARVLGLASTAAPPSVSDVDLDRDDIARARAEAQSLVRRSRFSQAAEILSAVAGPATRVLGAADPAVLSLRFELANAWFDGGEYSRAGSVYRDLAADVAAHLGPDDDLGLRARRQQATCAALTGDIATALRSLRALVDDTGRLHGAGDERVLELRKQIALLELGAGHLEPAKAALTSLLADVEGLRGPRDPIAVDVRAVLRDAFHDEGL